MPLTQLLSWWNWSIVRLATIGWTNRVQWSCTWCLVNTLFHSLTIRYLLFARLFRISSSTTTALDGTQFTCLRMDHKMVKQRLSLLWSIAIILPVLLKYILESEQFRNTKSNSKELMTSWYKNVSWPQRLSLISYQTLNMYLHKAKKQSTFLQSLKHRIVELLYPV